jgi:hypothetical protein
MPGDDGTDPKDATDVVEFLDFLLQVTYDLPHQIKQYRARKKPRTMTGHPDKIEIFRALERLEVAAERNMPNEAQPFREQLVHARFELLPEPIYRVVNAAFEVSGPWVRGIEPKANVRVLEAIRAAILALNRAP